MSGLGKTSDDGPAPVQPAPDRTERMIDDDRIRVYVEVTNTLITGGTTGMQRLCRQLLTSCWALDAADTVQVEIIAMRWCGGCQEHVLLTDSERELLFRPKPLPPSRLERIPKLLRRPKDMTPNRTAHRCHRDSRPAHGSLTSKPPGGTSPIARCGSKRFIGPGGEPASSWLTCFPQRTRNGSTRETLSGFHPGWTRISATIR